MEEVPIIPDTTKKTSKPKPTKQRSDDSGCPPSNESYMSEVYSRYGPFTPLSPLITDGKNTGGGDPGFFGEDQEDDEAFDEDYVEYMTEEPIV